MLSLKTNPAAILLAGLYALVAFFGHSMHANCHSAHHSVAAVHGCCHGCCHQTAPISGNQSTDNDSEVAKSDNLSQTHTDCAACQLLSKMSHGFQLPTPHAGFWLNTDFPPVVSEQLVELDSTLLFDARGPPALV